MTPEAALIEQTFQIVNKQGEKVPFILNPVQLAYDEGRTNRDIIVKARQQGFSSFIEALIVLACLTTENIRAVLIAHDRESTEKLFDRARFFVNNLRAGPMKMEVDLTRSSRREFYFTAMNSTFYIGTAGSESFGRGDTINLLHCSEVAMWPDPRAMTAGLFQAVPRDGTIWIESTANGRGNWFHLLATRAMEGRSRFRCHFFPWWALPEYAVPVSEPLELSEEEVSLKESFGLSDEQILWRREKLAEMDDSELVGGTNLFPQEYPATFDEAFLASGLSVFRQVPVFQKEPVERRRFLTVWERPVPGCRYVLGVDVAAGVGADRSVIEGLDCESFEQAFEWASDCVDPDELAYEIGRLAREYNMAFVVPELNNHGLATIETLRRIYPPSLILQRYQYDKREGIEKTDRLGWLTTQKTKSQLVTNLRRALRNGLKVYSEWLRSELSTFVEHEDGRLGAQSGCYDDRVIAMALAVSGYRYVWMPREMVMPVSRPQFSFREQRRLAIRGFVEKVGAKPSQVYGRWDSGFVV